MNFHLISPKDHQLYRKFVDQPRFLINILFSHIRLNNDEMLILGVIFKIPHLNMRNLRNNEE